MVNDDQVQLIDETKRIFNKEVWKNFILELRFAISTIEYIQHAY